MQKRPYVVVNMAVSADGKIDSWQRRGARISGAADTARVDLLRAHADAIVVGGKTLLAEDPRLTVRDAALRQERLDRKRPAQPMKVGLVSRIGRAGETASLPQPSRFLHDGGGRVVVHTTSQTRPDAVAWLESEGADVRLHDGARVDLAAAFESLADEGVEHVLVEGGSTLLAALLTAGLVDELQLAIAPLVLGGATAPTPVDGAGLTRDQAIRLTLASATPDIDGDVVLRYLVGAQHTT